MRSGDRGGHTTGLFRPIHWPCWWLRRKWAGAPPCSTHIVCWIAKCTSCSSCGSCSDQTHQAVAHEDLGGDGQSKSQSYFAIGGLPPIISSWRQSPWDSRPEIFVLRLNPCGHKPYVTSNILSDERMGLCLLNRLSLSSNVRIAHIASYLNSSFCTTHKCSVSTGFSEQIMPITYFMLQRQLSPLNGLKLDHRLLYFPCLASPCPIPRTCSCSLFCMTSACCLHNFVI
jgi:hypothetical protein